MLTSWPNSNSGLDKVWKNDLSSFNLCKAVESCVDLSPENFLEHLAMLVSGPALASKALCGSARHMSALILE